MSRKGTGWLRPPDPLPGRTRYRVSPLGNTSLSPKRQHILRPDGSSSGDPPALGCASRGWDARISSVAPPTARRVRFCRWVIPAASSPLFLQRGSDCSLPSSLFRPCGPLFLLFVPTLVLDKSLFLLPEVNLSVVLTRPPSAAAAGGHEKWRGKPGRVAK